MSFRDKALIGELRRDNERLQLLLAQANERLANIEQEVEVLRAAGAELERELTAIRHERAKVGESIKQTLDRVADAILEEDRPLYIRPGEMHRHPVVLAVKALIQSANNISSAGREHLRGLFAEAVAHGYSLRTIEVIGALLGAFMHGWAIPPGTCQQLAKTLQIHSPSELALLCKRSPLVTVTGRDEKKRLVYSLHLDLLAAETLPPPQGCVPWLNDRGRLG